MSVYSIYHQHGFRVTDCICNDVSATSAGDALVARANNTKRQPLEPGVYFVAGRDGWGYFRLERNGYTASSVDG